MTLTQECQNIRLRLRKAISNPEPKHQKLDRAAKRRILHHAIKQAYRTIHDSLETSYVRSTEDTYVSIYLPTLDLETAFAQCTGLRTTADYSRGGANHVCCLFDGSAKIYLDPDGHVYNFEALRLRTIQNYALWEEHLPLIGQYLLNYLADKLRTWPERFYSYPELLNFDYPAEPLTPEQLHLPPNSPSPLGLHDYHYWQIADYIDCHISHADFKIDKYRPYSHVPPHRYLNISKRPRTIIDHPLFDYAEVYTPYEQPTRDQINGNLLLAINRVAQHVTIISLSEQITNLTPLHALAYHSTNEINSIHFIQNFHRYFPRHLCPVLFDRLEDFYPELKITGLSLDDSNHQDQRLLFHYEPEPGSDFEQQVTLNDHTINHVTLAALPIFAEKIINYTLEDINIFIKYHDFDRLLQPGAKSHSSFPCSKLSIEAAGYSINLAQVPSLYPALAEQIALLSDQFIHIYIEDGLCHIKFTDPLCYIKTHPLLP